jgi:hypothetical protein
MSSIISTLRKKGLRKEAAELEKILEGNELLMEEYEGLLGDTSSEEEFSDEVSEEDAGPSRPAIGVYAERMADRLEDFVRRDLITDQPAEILAEILAHIVKCLEDKGYQSLKAPTLDANRTAKVRVGFMRAVSLRHKKISNKRK